MSNIIALVEIDKPGESFGELERALLEVGITTAEQLLLIPKDVLSVIGNMGPARARVLRNYTKHVILPLLGLRGDYKDPKITVDPKAEEDKHTCQETKASIDDIVDISESGNDDENDKSTTSNEDDAWLWDAL